MGETGGGEGVVGEIVARVSEATPGTIWRTMDPDVASLIRATRYLGRLLTPFLNRQR